jgi:hypothetical protein
MRRLILTAITVLLLATSAGAQLPQSPTQHLLLEGKTPDDLRARLFAFAESPAGARAEDAGEALYYAGASFERAGLLDSAIATYRRAVQVRGRDDERLALADALLLRREPGDIDSALAETRRGRTAALADFAVRAREYTALEGWGLVLADRADTALTLLADLPMELRQLPQWRYRLARAETKAGEPRRAFGMLMPLAIESRTQDKDVMGLVKDIGTKTGFGDKLVAQIEQTIAARDRAENRLLDRWGARRLHFFATDGFPLGGVLLAPHGTARHRAAIVLLAPGDSVFDYDSLAVLLRRANLAVLLMDIRGSGWSVDPLCPSPDTWRAREERLQTLCARDVRTAMRYLAKEVPLDSSRYVVVASGGSAPIAAEAAELDRRIAALTFISPEVPPTERGPTRSRLSRLQLPAYFQIAPDEKETYSTSEALFHAGDERRSRFAESNQMGHGPLQFHGDASVGARFTRWLREALPAPARPAAPRAKPRRG